MDVSDGVGEGGRGVLSLRQRGEIEGLDLVAAVWLDGELNVLVLTEWKLRVTSATLAGAPLTEWIVNIGGAAEEVAGGGIDVDAVLELIF